MRLLASAPVVVVTGLAVSLGWSGDAAAFCRTTTCPLPPDFSPSPGACYPDNFDQYCASLSPPAKPLPIWWANACVSYDIVRSGTRQIAFDTVSQIVSAAFAKWTGVTCPTSGTGPSRVSIDVRDLGRVDCGMVQYNSNQGNQHVIIFDDDVWPYHDASNTLGLTTVTFNPDTGEIYDADMEINATVPLSVTTPVPPNGYDFESIITHESGHFLGMAHSGDERATMFAHYTPGSSTMRVLTDDDVEGICSIDRPDGTRSIDPSVDAGPDGSVREAICDPTPRHGFSSQCANPPSKACAASVASAGASASGSGMTVPGASLAGAGLLCVGLRALRRRRAVASLRNG
jgi:hypothetical protein